MKVVNILLYSKALVRECEYSRHIADGNNG